MKRTTLILTLLFLSLLTRGDTLVQWDFNSPFDFDPATGTLTPLIGSGSAARLGTVTESFTAANGGTDPNTGDNSNWRLATFPTQGSGNKTSGVEFRLSTAGYENITMAWDQQNSATANRYWRIQYTDDGSNFVDYVVIENSLIAAWTNFSVSFAPVPAANNNSNFAVRILSEFQSTATGSGTAGYAPVNPASSYGVGGTLRLDMMTFGGSIQDTNNAQPIISAINDQTTRVNQASAAIPFTIGDAETAADLLTVEASSSNPTLVNGFSFGGSGSNRTLTLTPQLDQEGAAIITVRVTDADGKFNFTSFDLAVLPTNTPPTISSISHVTILANTSTNAAFTIGDAETVADDLSIIVASSNSRLIPVANISISPTGSVRTLTLTPVSEEAGASWITVTVSDGVFTNATSFMFKVLRSEIIALWNFNSVPPDTNVNTGTLIPAVGTGTATSAGTATNSLISNVAGNSFDPAPADNSKWRFGSFPAQGTENKTSGAEFRVSTAGYRDIAISWDHYNSATGSKYWRLQYSLDGANFVDFVVYTNPVQTTFFPTGASFAGIPGANDNPNFAVRIVSEFGNTATGAGADEYVATQAGSTYGTGGTLWLDMVTISGDSAATAPMLSILKTSSGLDVSWPATATGFLLQVTPGFSPIDWQPVTQAPVLSGDRNVVTLTNTGNNQFFRLAQ